MNAPRAPEPVVIDPRRNRRVAGYALGAISFMLAASFAAVPLYDLFCKTTGFGGTPVVAKAAPQRVAERAFTVRLDANVVPGLGWLFTPEVESLTLRAGEVKTVAYKVRNLRGEATTGIASYGVLPEQTGGFFNKISCFCFTELTLQPGEERSEEVVFFIDPAITAERELEPVKVITLSYTFFPARKAAKPLADATNLIGAPAGPRETVSR